jgi:predicted transcriptional regulator of viral defense system
METTKTLGPASAAILLRLSAEGKTIFSIADAHSVTNSTYKATTELLSQLVRKEWLVRLAPGKYLIVPLEAGLEGIPMADRYVIAREVLTPLPYYVSHYSALELHQMTTNPVNTIYVTVPKQQSSRSIAGIEYRFVYAGSRCFWGYEPMWVTDQAQVQVSDLEKTLLDCAFLPANFAAKCQHEGKDPDRLRAALVSKAATFGKLWKPRLAVQVIDLPDLGEVLRSVRQHLRSLGLV